MSHNHRISPLLSIINSPCFINTATGRRGYNSMPMEFLKTITGKVVAGFVGLAVIAGGISWWQMDPDTRGMLVSGTGKIVGWLLLVLVVPWATFFVIGRIGKMESNLAGAVLVA